MPVLLALAFLLVELASASLEASRNQAEDVGDRLRAIAVNMLVYHQAVNRWAEAHPGFAGPVPEAELLLPGWYRKAASWSAAIESDVAATFPSAPIPTGRNGRLVALLVAASDGDYGIGTASSGNLLSATRGPLFALPAGIADGTPVYATRIR